MKITKVYTRKGDQGLTSLVGGQRVSKASVRLEAYGTVDELSSHLGLLAAMLPEGHEKDLVERIQNNLFNVCTNLATDQDQTPLYPSAHLPEGAIKELEDEVDSIMHELPERQGFILPGGTQEAAQAHVCRTVCRRAERRIVALAEEAGCIGLHNAERQAGCNGGVNGVAAFFKDFSARCGSQRIFSQEK